MTLWWNKAPNHLFYSLLTAIAVVTFSACSTLPNAQPTPYQAAKTLGQGYGYSSEQLDTNLYNIMFKATDLTSADRVQQYTLLRAAEIAEQNGFDWVAVEKTHVEKKAVQGKTMVRSKSTPAPLTEQQCTMSGCTEVAQPFGGASGDMNMEVTSMNDVYYSIRVRMGPTQERSPDNAISVATILANRPKND